MQAAAPASNPAIAPAVTMPASAPVHCEMMRDARACSSAMSTQSCDAAAIAAITSASIGLAPRRVTVPVALITGTNCNHPTMSVAWTAVAIDPLLLRCQTPILRHLQTKPHAHE